MLRLQQCQPESGRGHEEPSGEAAENIGSRFADRSGFAERFLRQIQRRAEWIEQARNLPTLTPDPYLDATSVPSGLTSSTRGGLSSTCLPGSS